MAYSLFNIGRANNTVVGGKAILFDANAIDAHLGRNFIGQAAVNQYVYRFKAIQDTLAKRGTLLVFAIAPGKATFYAEHWPAYYQQQLPTKTTSNYDALAQQMKAAGVNVLDFNKIFLAWKDTTSYPLFTRGGIHWSLYGRDLAVDTLFQYIAERGRLTLPAYRFASREISDQPRDTDNDLAKVLNLIWEPVEFPMAYPKMQFDSLKPGQRKPNLLLVGDSFGWGLVPYLPAVFSEKSRFWYYNNVVDWAGEDNTGEQRSVSALNRPVELAQRDVILVLFTEPNLVAFDQGFSADAYRFLCPFTPAELARINTFIAILREDRALEAHLWQKAHNQNLNFDYLLFDEAVKHFELEKIKALDGRINASD